MTKADAVKIIGIENETFDYALPQPWVDEVVKVTGHPYPAIIGQLVWLYDAAYRHGGRPCALTLEANKLLGDINRTMGSNWPLTENPANPDLSFCHECYKQPEEQCPCYERDVQRNLAFACDKAITISSKTTDIIHVWQVGRYYEWGDEACRRSYSSLTECPAVRSYQNGHIVYDTIRTHEAKTFVNRDWALAANDDFALNVAPKMSDYQEAMPAYSEDGKLAGWFIQQRYE